MLVSAEAQIEQQKQTQTVPLEKFGLVFAVQLDSINRLKAPRRTYDNIWMAP